MPKFLVGCLVMVLLLVVGGGTAGYFFVIKPAYDFAMDAGSFATEFQTLNERVEQDRSFRPPADGELSQEQFQRFLVAQRDITEGMAGRLTELEEKWRELQADLDARDREPGITELVTAYRDLAELLLEARRNQVEALNRYQFSAQEYAWVRNQVFRALGQDVAVMSLGPDASQARQTHTVPEATVEMVSAHREEIMKNYSLAWFGL
ncbi:MAG: hypothetical protein ACXIUB_00910 [Wenzhouxiangella sp.]